jgi:hypothetical protein
MKEWKGEWENGRKRENKRKKMKEGSQGKKETEEM